MDFVEVLESIAKEKRGCTIYFKGGNKIELSAPFSENTEFELKNNNFVILKFRKQKYYFFLTDVSCISSSDV